MVRTGTAVTARTAVPDTGMSPLGGGTGACAVALAAVLAISGCGGSSGAAQTPPPAPARLPTSAATPAPSPSPSPGAAVLAQYAAFWAAITPASRTPAEGRRAILTSYATDPELSRLLRGLLAAEAAGEGQYGAEVPHARVTSIRDDTASVADCQDASHAGRTSLATGKPITRGIARNPVRATLRRGADGRWRVETVIFPGGSC